MDLILVTLQKKKKDTVKASINNIDPRKPVPMMSVELDVNHLLLICMKENNNNSNIVDIRNDIPVETAESYKYY